MEIVTIVGEEHKNSGIVATPLLEAGWNYQRNSRKHLDETPDLIIIKSN
jgi:hypothetical protein